MPLLSYVLAIGTKLSVFGTLPCYDIDYFPKDAKIIQVDINPRNIARTHPIEVGIIADAKASTVEIANRLKSAIPDTARNQEHLSELATLKEDWEKELVDLAMEDGNPINPRRALLELTKVLPENAMVSTDIGNVSSTANAYLKFNSGHKHIAALTFGNTGFAYPAALSAKVADPDSTAVEQNIPVVACVFNNNA